MLSDMKKVMVIGHRSDRHELLKTLHKSRMVEVFKTRPIDDTIRLDNTERIAVIQEKMNRLIFALKFLRESRTVALKLVKDTKKSENPYQYTQIKEPMFSSIKTLTYDEFMDVSSKEYETLAYVSELEEINQKTNSLNAEKVKLETENRSLEIYNFIEEPFNFFHDTNKTFIYLGLVPTKQLENLRSFIEGKDNFIFESFLGNEKDTPFVLVCLKENEEDALEKLHELESERCQINSDKSAKDIIEQNNNRIASINEELLELLTSALEKERYIRDFKTLYDYYSIASQKLDALDLVAATQRAFVIEGWYPANREKELAEKLDAVSSTIIYEFSEPEEGDIQPTYQKPNRFLDGFRGVTNMYAPPLKGTDIDPTIFVAFFYFILFGLMLADAAYGLILTIGGLILYRLMKPVPGKGNLIILISLCGVSTFIWGVLFGTWFSIDIPADNFLMKIQWFNPLYEPIKMLILSYVVGIIHIGTGMIINGVVLCKKGQIRQAFGSSFSWIMVIIGLVFFAFKMVLGGINTMFGTHIDAVVPGWLKYIGIVFIGLGVLCILLCSSNKKNPFKRIFGGVAKLYDGVNILSDVLSYSRLFGLGLASAVVGMVVNQVAMVFINLIPYAGYVLAVVILLVGHIFNIAINTLGAYIHDCRLQYIEFFGKFYSGGGHVFMPFGSKTKYTYIDMK